MDIVEAKIVRLINKLSLCAEKRCAVNKDSFEPGRWFFFAGEDFSTLVSHQGGLSNDQALYYLVDLVGCPEPRKQAFFAMMQDTRLEVALFDGSKFFRPSAEFFTAEDLFEKLPLISE